MTGQKARNWQQQIFYCEMWTIKGENLKDIWKNVLHWKGLSSQSWRLVISKCDILVRSLFWLLFNVCCVFLYSGLENQFNNVIIVTFPAVFVLIFFVINIKPVFRIRIVFHADADADSTFFPMWMRMRIPILFVKSLMISTQKI